MGHDQGRCRAEFDREVAVRDGIERVLADAVEVQRASHPFAIDRITGARQGGGTQRQAIDAASAVGHPVGVAGEHLDVGHQVMTEGDRLRDLQMGEAGHDRPGVAFGQIDQRALQITEQPHGDVDLGAQPQPDVGGHLVVARARGVQPLAGVARQIGQPFLDVQVNIFQVELPAKGAVLDLGADAGHAVADGVEIDPRQNAAGFEHFGMRERALYVVQRESMVEAHRGGVAFDEFGYRL